MEREAGLRAPWSDLEKCIFLDKFLTFPKNFGKIATFLTNKSAKDCVRFYYDSKQTVNYKAMLREHQQRRRGLKTSYNEMTNAVESMGGAMVMDDEENEVDFALPPDESTFSSHAQHPPRMWTDSGPGSLAKRRLAKKTSAESKQADAKSGRGRKRSLDPRDAVGGAAHPSQTRKKQLSSGQLEAQKLMREKQTMRAREREAAANDEHGYGAAHGGGGRPHGGVVKHAPKWNSQEKLQFLEHFTAHGKNWPLITQLIPTKSEAQVKNYYQNYKTRLGLQDILVPRRRGRS